MAAYQQDRWSDGGARGIGLAASADAGRTWTRTAIPISGCAKAGSGPTRVSDPWVSIGPDGIAYLIAIAVGDGVRMITSIDGARTWTHIVRIPVGARRTFADKPTITAHPTTPGVAYAVWNEDDRTESRPRDAILSTTRDGGGTWTTPRLILEGDPDGGGAVGDQILVDPRAGTLYHIYTWEPLRDGKAQTAHVGLQVSSDDGISWSASHLIHRIDLVEGGTKTPGGQRIRSGAGVIDGGIDPRNGTLYLVWEDARFERPPTGAIALSRSDDGGQTWTEPQRISPPAAEAAFTPMAQVDQGGRIGVSFYAIREGTTSAPTDVWFLRSDDDGKTFGSRIVDGPFELARAPHADGLFLGDYAGLDAGPDGFVMAYAITTTGSTGPTDVRAASLP